MSRGLAFGNQYLATQLNPSSTYPNNPEHSHEKSNLCLKFFHNFIRYIFISCCFQQYPPRHIHYITTKIIIQANAITS